MPRSWPRNVLKEKENDSRSTCYTVPRRTGSPARGGVYCTGVVAVHDRILTMKNVLQIAFTILCVLLVTGIIAVVLVLFWKLLGG